MSNFKIPFTLRQHTPIIHFQADQSGATLRATELKPKLDKFLLKMVKDIPFKTNANKHRSLDYKIKISQDLTSPENIEDRNPLFFGNMGDGEKKKFKQNNKNITIEFLSFEPKILEAINSNFEAFLANTNFGTRQSKGFGSFYLYKKEFNKSLIPYKVYSFESSKWERDIGLFYQFLRQGINLPRPNNPFYTKPAIFAYAKSKGWQWDKKSIKEAYFSNALDTQIESHSPSDVLEFSSNQKYLLRDLFGLSSSQEWKSYKTTIEKEHQEIERFKSPITFKVVDDVVYFWANDSVNEILDKTFTIKAGRRDSLKLATPKSFNFDDFFKFSFKIDLDRHIDSKFHNTNEFKTLNKIFNELRKQIWVT